jgi:DNA-binding transcriptional LysR family regulator
MIGRKYEYLIALASEGHFARAAQGCHVSQPALSAGIQQLEEELGVQIVKRGRRFQGLTPEGEMVLAWAKRMEVEHRRFREELRACSDSFGGILRLGVMNSTTPFISIFTLPFQEHFPEVNFRVMNHNPFEIQQGLEEFSFDVAFTYLDDRPNRYRYSHPLYVQEYYVMIRKGSLFSGKESVSWEELRHVPLCLYPPETQVLGTEVAHLLGEGGRGRRLETNSILVLLDYVSTGKWASILPKPVLFMVAGSDKFEAIPLPRTPEAGSVGIAVPHREPPCELARLFFESATEREVLKTFHEFLGPTPALSRGRLPPQRPVPAR